MGFFKNLTDKRFYTISNYIKNMPEDEVMSLGMMLFTETIFDRKSLHNKLKQTYWRMDESGKQMLFMSFNRYLNK